MDTTELLLAHDPHDAVIMMLNLENGTSFPVGDFEVSTPTPTLTDPNTEVTIRVRNSRQRFDILPYTTSGPITFRYNRLDVGQYFYGVLEGFEPELPTSTQILLDEITQRVGQRFVLDDFELEDISRDNVLAYILRAKTESLRWIGEMPIVVSGLLPLDWYIGELLSGDLGAITPAIAFTPVNALQPELNATSVQTALQSLEVDKPTQDGLLLHPSLNQILHHPSQASFRTPIYSNGYFEDGLMGWNTQGIVTISGRHVRLVKDNTIAMSRIYRNLVTAIGGLIEVTVHISKFNVSDTRELRIELLDHDLNSVASYQFVADYDNEINQINRQGLVHIYFISPLTNPTIAVTLGPSSNNNADEVWLEQFSCTLFPPQWIPAGEVISTESDGSYVLPSYPTDHWVSHPKLAVQGRSTYIECKVRTKGSQLLGFQGSAATLLDGALVDPTGLSDGDTFRVVLNNPATTDSVSNTLNIFVSSNDTWVFDSFRVCTLPYAWKRDLIPQWDGYLNETDTATSLNISASDYTVVPAFSPDGYLNVTYTAPAGATLRVDSLGLAEQESVTLRVKGSRPTDSQFIEMRHSHLGSQAHAMSVTWNTGDPLRFNFAIPSTQFEAYSLIDTVESSSVPRLTFAAYDNVVDASMESGTQFTIELISLALNQSRWIRDSTPSFNTIYNALIADLSIEIDTQWNRLYRTASAATVLQIDPQKTLAYSHETVWLPYTPWDKIPSNFSPKPQLTLYGISTTDDGTYFRDALLLLEPPMLINTSNLPAIVDMDIFGQNHPWVVNENESCAKNLFGAMVQYNGPLRPTIDPQPAIQGLNRVCVLYLSDTYCTNYRGIVRFYYR